ncbi:DNA topoisomerase IB [Chitinophaga nivalis]|uniref:DNA topoisomerase n=1 Tax=Chitinophaga nivalis TaxID=2991709 RepID=A0ABT3IRN9_9BACT|nr:DNA topoisomerase IB [Chitinophaga nivalis]MCW3463676.1 DNA topoisomerase IB [Chitinophaga nivalis]MCW3486634.1 DNA topoisomerase IB [Chitinophaga nivalis]
MLALSIQQVIKKNDLKYVINQTKGIYRQRKGKKFIYIDHEGHAVTAKETLDRITRLVLPPAWEQVWICPFENGHLQAIGYDVKGRKQYRYHAEWSRIRNEQKYERLYDFGKKLPALRMEIQKSLRTRQLTKDKVAAIALSIIDNTGIRIGNTSYERENGSYGLTTLKNRHAQINGNITFFRFKGKKGVQQLVPLRNSALTHYLKQVKEIPGQELFQYYDETGAVHSLDSGDLNDYLKRNMHEDFTCKDMRTWTGSVTAVQLMAEMMSNGMPTTQRKSLLDIIDGVAQKLGNTRAVCRKYYIHPALLTAYEEQTTATLLKALIKNKTVATAAIEKALLSFLKRQL